MKKGLLFLLVFGMNSLYALDYNPQTLDLVFQSLLLDSNRISNSFCDTIESEWTVKLGKYCEASASSIAYNSPEDESVYIEIRKEGSSLAILLYRENQTCVDPFRHEAGVSGTAGKLQFSEVLYSELLRLQSFGIIQMQRDSLEDFLQGKIELMKEAGKCDDIDRVSFYEENGAEWLFGPGCCSLVESSESLPRISPASPGVRATKVSPGKFRLMGVPLGTEISVFNLKGQTLLRKSFDGGLLEIPNVPAVAKVGGDWVKFE